MMSKKSYGTPSLEKLGTLAQITAAATQNGAKDNSTGKNQKT